MAAQVAADSRHLVPATVVERVAVRLNGVLDIQTLRLGAIGECGAAAGLLQLAAGRHLTEVGAAAAGALVVLQLELQVNHCARPARVEAFDQYTARSSQEEAQEV